MKKNFYHDDVCVIYSIQILQSNTLSVVSNWYFESGGLKKGSSIYYLYNFQLYEL